MAATGHGAPRVAILFLAAQAMMFFTAITVLIGCLVATEEIISMPALAMTRSGVEAEKMCFI